MEVTPIFRKLQRSKAKVVSCRGGTRSSKTYSLCQMAFTWLLKGKLLDGDTYEPSGIWSIIRGTYPSLRFSVYRDFIEIVQAHNAEQIISHSRTEHTFTYGSRVVEFFALEDNGLHKIRSRKRSYCHLCEANEISFEAFTQLIIRTSKRMYLDFNPDQENWIKTEIEDARYNLKNDTDIIISTYLDNPYLTREEISEIEYLAKVSPELWAVFGLGEWGKVTGTIYEQPTVIKSFPKDLEIIYGGLDWGFSNSYTAAIKIGRQGEDLYLEELLYDRGLVNSQIMDRLPKNILYVADSAEPKSISDFQRAGFRMVASVKGPDSVRAGINRLKEFKIHVTSSSTNLLKEFRNYKWDKDGDPIPAFDHGLDAVRYCVSLKMKRAQESGIGMIINSYGRAVS